MTWRIRVSANDKYFPGVFVHYYGPNSGFNHGAAKPTDFLTREAALEAIEARTAAFGNSTRYEVVDMDAVSEVVLTELQDHGIL